MTALENELELEGAAAELEQESGAERMDPGHAIQSVGRQFSPGALPPEVTQAIWQTAKFLWQTREYQKARFLAVLAGLFRHNPVGWHQALMQNRAAAIRQLALQAGQMAGFPPKRSRQRPGFSDVQVRQYHRRQQQRGYVPGRSRQTGRYRELEGEFESAAHELEFEQGSEAEFLSRVRQAWNWLAPTGSQRRKTILSMARSTADALPTVGAGLGTAAGGLGGGVLGGIGGGLLGLAASVPTAGVAAPLLSPEGAAAGMGLLGTAGGALGGSAGYLTGSAASGFLRSFIPDTEAAMEMAQLSRLAEQAETEAEAEAFLGAMAPLVSFTTPSAARALIGATPGLAAGLAAVGRRLRARPQTRPLIGALPGILQQTALRLGQRLARGRAVTPQSAGRAFAGQMARVFANRRRTELSYLQGMAPHLLAEFETETEREMETFFGIQLPSLSDLARRFWAFWEPRLRRAEQEFYNRTIRHGCFCGPGSVCNVVTDSLDRCCQAHDAAYTAVGVNTPGGVSMFTLDGVKRTIAADETLARCSQVAINDGTPYPASVRRFQSGLVQFFTMRAQAGRTAIRLGV